MDKGIVIGCSTSDFHLAKGCLASIKYFMPDARVCLLHDGPIDREQISIAYPDVIFLGKQEVKNDFLRQNGFGYGITKMIAFWESPFENFLFMDADTIMWGPLNEWQLLENADMAIDQPQYVFSEEAIDLYFFNLEVLKQFDTSFEPLQFNDRYFCTGAYYSRKNVFELEWYKELLNYCKTNPGAIFKFGEMGLLNYMIFKKLQVGKLKVVNKWIQFLAPDFTKEEMKERYSFVNEKPVVNTPMILHFNGNRKPWIKNKFGYNDPMTWFRTEYLKKIIPQLGKGEIMKILLKEDTPYSKNSSLINRAKRYVAKKRDLFFKKK
jgi:hypothetical protein